MQTVRCKMRCNSVTDHGNQQSVIMNPTYSNDPESENKQFWDATPGGQYNINYVNKNIEFLVGREYYIDVTLAPLPEPVQEA
jgi:hypothetical protein